MDNYTSNNLSYFASTTPFPLPTYEEIVAQEPSAFIHRDPGRNIVKVGNFVVKYGEKIEFAEGENMLMVRLYSKIPVPTLYAAYRHEPSGNNVLIMEFIEGKVLSSCYDELDPKQKASIGAQLRRQLRELRKIPSPGFYGSVGNRPYLAYDWILKSPAGPFDSADEFLKAHFSAQFSDARESARPEIEKLKSQLLRLTKRHNAPVFTHADLQSKNIILRDDGSICIIDWESASYCPEYFEFFIYRTYDMVIAGLSKSDKDDFLEYGEIVQLIIKIWNRYIVA